MVYTLKFGCASWIKAEPNPLRNWFVRGTQALTLEPSWIPKTYVGLYATRNDPPADVLNLERVRGAKQYRALAYAELRVDGENVSVVESVLDPGFTPPFRWSSVPGGMLERATWSWKFEPGEMSTCSNLTLMAKHPNSTLSIRPNDRVLASMLIKFRAGATTDAMGINKVGCPFHVPWVWSEVAICYSAARNQHVLYGNGSMFPTHDWFVGGEGGAARIEHQPEVADSQFPRRDGNKNEIDVNALRLYPVLRAGQAGGAQTPANQDSASTDPVTSHGNTAAAGPGPKRIQLNC